MSHPSDARRPDPRCSRVHLRRPLPARAPAGPARRLPARGGRRRPGPAPPVGRVPRGPRRAAARARRVAALRADGAAPQPLPRPAVRHRRRGPRPGRRHGRRRTCCSASRPTSCGAASLPLLKGGQPVAVSDAERRAGRGARPGPAPERRRDGPRARRLPAARSRDRRRQVRRRGREGRRRVGHRGAAEVVRRPPARRARTARGSSSRSPENVDYFNLVEVEHRRPDLPTAMEGPASHLRRRDGFTLTDPRMTGREVLGEINYCVLCHERDKDSCSKGLLAKDGTIQAEPARHRARRLPARRADLRDAHAAQARRRRSARSRWSRSTTRCARARPPHLQRLHEGLHLPEAGSGQHPADRDGHPHRRAARCRGASRSTACSRAGTR